MSQASGRWRRSGTGMGHVMGCSWQTGAGQAHRCRADMSESAQTGCRGVSESAFSLAWSGCTVCLAVAGLRRLGRHRVCSHGCRLGLRKTIAVVLQAVRVLALRRALESLRLRSLHLLGVAVLQSLAVHRTPCLRAHRAMRLLGVLGVAVLLLLPLPRRWTSSSR